MDTSHQKLGHDIPARLDMQIIKGNLAQNVLILC